MGPSVSSKAALFVLSSDPAHSGKNSPLSKILARHKTANAVQDFHLPSQLHHQGQTMNGSSLIDTAG